MLGTEFTALFLKCRIKPLQHRSHGMWLYTRATDKTRVGRDLSDKELKDEVRRLTCLTAADSIPLDALVDAYEFSHLPHSVRCRQFSRYSVLIHDLVLTSVSHYLFRTLLLPE